MGKLKFWLCFPVILLAFASCSEDDDKFVYTPKIPGENIGEGQIQIIFEATAENPTIKFEIDADYLGEFQVDWDDKNDPKPKKYTQGGTLTYTYPAEENTHVITLSARQIEVINFMDGSAKFIKGLYFGNCPSLQSLSFVGDNNLEKFDVTRCPSMWGSLTLIINNPKFDFSGVKDIPILAAYVNTAIDINIENSSVEILDIFFTGSFLNPNLKIKNCPYLTKFTTHGYNVFNPYDKLSYNSLEIESTALKSVRIENVYIEEGLDLSNASDLLEDVYLWSFDCAGVLKFPKSMKTFGMMDFTNLSKKYQYYYNDPIREIDVSACVQLKTINIQYSRYLETLKLGNLKKLENIYLQWNDQLKSLSIDNITSLSDLSIWGNKKLESVLLKDIESLPGISIEDNPLLNTISTENIPLVSQVEIKGNNLSEDAIKSFFSGLNNALTADGKKRTISIAENPGDTPAVRSFIETSGNWITSELNTSSAKNKLNNNLKNSVPNTPSRIQLKGN